MKKELSPLRKKAKHEVFLFMLNERAEVKKGLKQPVMRTSEEWWAIEAAFYRELLLEKFATALLLAQLGLNQDERGFHLCYN